MKRYLIGWGTHWLLTVLLWYGFSAIAQGVVDGSGMPSLPLMLLNDVVRIFMAPLLLFATSFLPNLGGFSIASMLAFATIAAANSAIVMAIIVSAVGWFERRRNRPAKNSND